MAVVTGCYIEPANDGFSVIGYIPVYGSHEMSEIKLVAPQQVNNPGKIYVYHRFLLVNESKEGIHIFDNSNPAAPESIGFLQMLGNTDMAIKDDILYADHMGNLVALTTNNFETLVENGRLKLKNWNVGIPPPRGAHFQCIDSSKGLVIGWKQTENKNFDCYAL